MSEGVANDNIRPGIQSSIEYLMSGGLGEVIGFTDLALRDGQPKVQCDSDLAMALCLLASEAIDARRASIEGQ